MNAGQNRIRLGLEQLEDRCTPSATPLNLAALFPVQPSELHGPTAVLACDSHTHTMSIKNQTHTMSIQLAVHVISDASGALSVRGHVSHLGHITAVGQIGQVNIDQAADRVNLAGTVTLTAKHGDQLFISFTDTFRLSTRMGVEEITFTGGTGRFTGATGGATLHCHAYGTNPTELLVFQCHSKGAGFLFVDHL
jgi:hypothetical protein